MVAQVHVPGDALDFAFCRMGELSEGTGTKEMMIDAEEASLGGLCYITKTGLVFLSTGTSPPKIVHVNAVYHSETNGVVRLRGIDGRVVATGRKRPIGLQGSHGPSDGQAIFSSLKTLIE
jgi:hypothetical protein